MINQPLDIPRHVVPRWRFYSDTASTGDLAGVGAAGRKFRSIERYRRAWLATSNVISAGEFIMAATVTGGDSHTLDAANFLVEESNGAAPGLIHLAKRMIDASGHRRDLRLPSSGQFFYRTMIRQCRARLSTDPSDSISWTDMARAYFSLGDERKAGKALNVALSLAPNSRFVLRAAARLKIHQKRFDEAHYLLYASPRTPLDPWLIAGEMACATLAERSPRTVGHARRILRDDNFPKRAVSELAAEFGTLELQNGKRRDAKKLFNEAVKDPNENALAQIEWITKAHKVAPEITLQQLDLPFAYEASQGVEYRLRHWFPVLGVPSSLDRR